MEPHYIIEFVRALLRELSRKQLLAAMLFSAVSLVVLVVGLAWPLKYSTSATLYVDRRNSTIIEPLLRGQAEFQDVDNAQEAKDRIYTRQMLEGVAIDAGLIDADATSKDIAWALAKLGNDPDSPNGIQIENSGRNYLTISYQDFNPQISYNVVNALVEAFIKNIAETKQQASQEAHDFIETQAEVYKDKLLNAERRLKNFQVSNRDGTEESVEKRIEGLRTEIETVELNIDELQSRIETITRQLSDEREYLGVRSQTDALRQRLMEAQTRLDGLLVYLTKTHPDVIAAQMQVDEYRQAIRNLESGSGGGMSTQTSDQLSMNPLFEEMRSNLSAAEVELNAARNRKHALEKLLHEERNRGSRLAETRAQLSELNRDYNVTRDLYEDMLGRKERARLSMTIDEEGQGTAYKIHEPPTFPLKPSGYTSMDFMLFGPLLGLMAPVGLIGLYIFLDPRIRLPSELVLIEGCELLTITHPIKDVKSARTLKAKIVLTAIIVVSCTAAYSWISYNFVLGSA